MIFWASLGAQTVKNRPAIWETWVQSPAREDPLKKVMATHSSILAWRIPWTEEGSRLWGHKESDMTEQHSLSLSLFLSFSQTGNISSGFPRGLHNEEYACNAG